MILLNIGLKIPDGQPDCSSVAASPNLQHDSSDDDYRINYDDDKDAVVTFQYTDEVLRKYTEQRCKYDECSPIPTNYKFEDLPNPQDTDDFCILNGAHKNEPPSSATPQQMCGQTYNLRWVPNPNITSSDKLICQRDYNELQIQ